ncbi:sensor histidine kinase [Hyphomonas johnsonii]|nr:HAMP domain-containing sensor histidine kinase [Hyphomonas johnsonii]
MATPGSQIAFLKYLLQRKHPSATAVDRVVLLEQHLAFASHTATMAGVMLVNSTATTIMIEQSLDNTSLRFWLFLNWLLAAVLVIDAILKRGRGRPNAVSGRYLRRSEWLAFLFGGVWGSLPFFVGGDAGSAMLYATLLTLPMIAGMSALLPSVPRVALRYATAAVLTLLTFVAISQPASSVVMSIMILVFILAVYFGMKRTFMTFVSNVESRIRATDSHQILIGALNASGQAFAYLDAKGNVLVQNDLHKAFFSGTEADLTSGSRRLPKAGDRYWQKSVESVPNGGHVILHTDVTDLEQSKREIEIAKEEAETADAAKTRFLNSMSRELKVPLDVIVGCSGLMGSDSNIPFDETEFRRYADQIRKHASYLGGIIDQIISFSKLNRETVTAEEEVVELAEIVNSAVGRVRLASPAYLSVPLQVSMEPGLPKVYYDRTALERIVQNLVTNAFEHGSKSPITVKVSRIVGRGILLMVRDRGAGMAKQDMDQAFEPFFQGGRANEFKDGRGVGLGLTVSRKLARQHDGDVLLDSHEGRGTSAFLVIPPSRCVTGADRQQQPEPTRDLV